MTDGYDQSINLLEAARAMRQRDNVRRNLVLARSARHDAISRIDLRDKSPEPN